MPTSVLWNLIGGLLSPLSRRAWRGRISQLSPKPSPSCDQVAGPTPLSGGVTALWGQPGPENQRPMGTPGCDMGGSFRGNTRGWGTNGVTLPLSSPETPGLAQGTWPRAEGRGQPAARGPHSPLAPLPPSARPSARCHLLLPPHPQSCSQWVTGSAWQRRPRRCLVGVVFRKDRPGSPLPPPRRLCSHPRGLLVSSTDRLTAGGHRAA